MDYTAKQYELMEKLSNRVLWDNLTEDEQDLASYLEHQGVARPRVDIVDDLWTLSPDGERVLDAHRQKVRDSQIRESIRQENIRKEQSAIEENNRILEKERASREKEKRSDRRFQLFLAILQALLSLIVGMLIEHFTGIVAFFASMFG